VSREVLYFPYISVPEDAWFTRALLYWDGVGSIVPTPFAEAPGKLTPYMQELLAAKLVRTVSPEHHDGPLYGPLERFLEYVDVELRAGRVQSLASAARPAKRGEVSAGTIFQIHSRKLGDLVGKGLVERGLARRADAGDWYEVESRVAADFMAYLATALGTCVDMEPITDSATHLATFTHASNGSNDPIRLLHELRAGVLESMLPAPAEPVSVAELASFKERYGSQLSSFRRAIEDRLVDLALVEEEWARARKLEIYHEELRVQLDELQARMQERRWPKIVFGAVCGLVAAAIPGVREVVAGHPVEAGLAAPGLISTMYLGIPKLRENKDFMRSPLAYAALAQQQLA